MRTKMIAKAKRIKTSSPRPYGGVFLGFQMIPHEYFEKVKKHFNNDDKKAWEWFQSVNMRLGVFTPLNLLKLGKQKKVMDYIDQYMK